MSLRTTAALVLACTLAAACSRAPQSTRPARRADHKVFVMGFDGMDPTLARKFMDEGKLPHLKKLAEQGSFATLGSTQPSESPTAWSSFATGVNPGKHNIYDFLVRDFDTYLPDVGMLKKEPAEYRWGLFEVKPPTVTSLRGSTSFWVHAGRDGVRSIVLTVPVTFPPEAIEHGEMLAGLPLPDLRGTVGTFYYWATDLTSFEEGNTEFGGYLKTLLFDAGVAETVLKGPENPILRQQERELRDKKRKGALGDAEQKRLDELAKGKDVLLPMTLRWKEDTGQAEIEIQGRRLSLKAGQWSDWVPLRFEFNVLNSVKGMTQFYVARADKELQIYASPLNLDPRDPALPISKPEDFAPRLAEQLGLFRTLGWAESADKALNEGRLSEADFLYDSERAFDDRERTILKNLERSDWDLFVAAIETTDRVSHMMWRLIDPQHPMYDAQLSAEHGDAIEKVYRRADGMVGKLIEKLPPNTTFMVMSDHGFHSFRRGVNLNTWLVQNGYMRFEGQREGSGADELFGRGKFFEGVDWSRTRAYAVGLGQIYFNLRGREGRGIVSAGDEYAALQDEVRGKLLELKDPEGGAPVFRDVYKRDDIYKGEFLQNAPDLQVGFNTGYRVGWQDTLGGVTRSVVENNNRKWSGDHCATATEISGGVLFSNRRIDSATPSIMDLGPTVLKLLGVPLPAELDGRPLL
jgi:predicted AlkP superfamily phosphohydrolase/phosphomutase